MIQSCESAIQNNTKNLKLQDSKEGWQRVRLR